MAVIAVTFRCDERQWQQFCRLCDAADETPGTVLRDLLRLEVQRRTRKAARSDEVIDERLLVRLRLLVAEALAEARGWAGMQAALARRGLAYQPAGGGLVLVDIRSGAVLCKGSQAGPGYIALVRRMGCAFPGHRQATLAARVLARP